MFARLAGNVPLECLDGPSTSEVQPYHYLICQSAPTPWVLAQRKALGGLGAGSANKQHQHSKQAQQRRVVLCRAHRGRPGDIHALRRPPKLISGQTGKLNASSGAISLPSLNSSAGSAITAEQLLVWLESVNTFTELERIVTAFAGSSSSWGSRHLALAISKVPQVTVPGGSSNGGSSSAAERQLQLVEQLAGSLGPALGQLSVQEISRVSWALAQVGYSRDPSLPQRLAAAFFPKLFGRKQHAVPQAVVTLAVGLAGLGWADVEGWQRLREAGMKLLARMDARGVAQLVWAFSTARQQDAGLCAAAAALLRGRLEELEPEEVVAVVSGLLAAGYEDRPLFEEAAASMVARLERAGAGSVAVAAGNGVGGGEEAGGGSSVWAAATLERLDPALCVLCVYRELAAAGQQRPQAPPC